MRKIITALSLILISTTASFSTPNVWIPPQERASNSVIKVQSSQAADEQVRLLNGKVEEMNFLILQLQEQIRKMQEDNEFRFQELEKSSQTPDKAASVEETPKQETVIKVEPTQETPKNLGSLKFDENGNAVDASIEEVINSAPKQEEVVSDNPKDLYRAAYDHVLAGEYEQAEKGFRSYIKKFPKDEKISDARYWLGESLAGQEKHKEAAEVLLKAQREFPKARKAPDMLLKLGISLAALDNKDVACATFAQVSKKYPKAGPTLLSRVSEEQAKAGC